MQREWNGHLRYDPTINLGLGSARCLSLLNPNSAGSGIFGMLSAVHGLNTGILYLQNRVKGPKWLPFVIGFPPLLLFSGSVLHLEAMHFQTFLSSPNILKAITHPGISKKSSEDYLQV